MRKLDRKLSKKLQKSLSGVICRIKSQAPNLRIASATSKLIHGCRTPQSRNQSDESEPEKTEPESASGARRIEKTEATLEDIDRFMFENFKSLYVDKCESDRVGDSASYESSRESFETPDLTTPSDVFGSRRFFVSPSSSSNDAEGIASTAGTDQGFQNRGGLEPTPAHRSVRACSTVTASSTAKPEVQVLNRTRGGGKEKSVVVSSEDCIAVLKASADPIEDFRQSMREVMEARSRHGERVDWGFMEELLFCYLRLNEKKYYRFVLDAFVGSVVDMRRIDGDGGGGDDATEVEVSHKGKEREN